MERSLVALPNEGNEGIFTRKGSIFGSGHRTPTSSKSRTSSGSRRTANASQSSTGSIATASTASSSGAPPLSRKASFPRLTKSPPKPKLTVKPNSFGTAFVVPNFIPPNPRGPPLSIDTANLRKPSKASLQLGADKSRGSGEAARVAVSNRESWASTVAYTKMISAPFNPADIKQGRSGSSAGTNGMTPLSSTISNTPASPSMETITYQHIQEIASKRISTLDYLRKAHEGRVYWFNTLLFNKPDLARMPYFDSKKLARRATNYLLLGVSLPTILDLNSSNALEFLRSLNALLAEFESYQLSHPPDGSAGSLSRGRLPQMFKRAASSSTSKGRRTSSAAADIGLPMGSETDLKSLVSGISTAGIVAASFPTGDNDLLPGEEYSLLLTPSLPFDPDFYETFATLCDVLIDCYTRLMSLLATPKDCNPFVSDLFFKADGRIRKIIVHGVVKEFEDSTRVGAKNEVASIGKVVLGGLM